MIQKNNLGINTNSLSNQIRISVFPNPSIDKLNVEIDLQNAGNISMELVDLTGKILQTIPNKEVYEGKTAITLDVSKLAAGNYIIALKINGANHNKVFIKQ